MRDRLILHAGMHKTGSTSIQHALASGTGAGVHRVRLGQSNPSAPLALMFEQNPGKRFAFIRSGESEKSRAARRSALYQRLDKQLSNRGEQTFLLSAEWLSVAPVDALSAFHDCLRPYFRAVDVYAYIRPPGPFAASALQQGYKTGTTGFRLRWPGYRDRFEKLDRLFGGENVHLRIFAPDRLKGGDVVQDFAHWSGLSLAPGQTGRANTSMSAAALALLACYRRNHRDAGKSAHNLKRDRKIVRAIGALKSRRFRICPERLATLARRNADDLGWIEARLGEPLPPEAVDRSDGILVESEDDLKRLAARFSPLLDNLEPREPPVDPEDADALAWRALRRFVDRLPEDG